MRYMLKFAKEGDLKYTSHLDMIRMFKRGFARAGIDLLHSQGFNPHPKMTLMQPLPLGYTSIGERMEFETVDSLELDHFKPLIETLPKGIRVLEIKAISETGPSIAAECVSAEYIIGIAMDRVSADQRNLVLTELENIGINAYLDQKEIYVAKKNKQKKMVQLDIRPMIQDMRLEIVDNNIFLTTLLDAGSFRNLSPELLIKSFIEFFNLPVRREDVEVLRTELNTII